MPAPCPADVARIRRLVDEARFGRGGALVVRGEPGTGRAALVAEAVTAAHGMTVLEARPVAWEAEIGYSSLFDILRPILACLERLPTVQAEVIRGALALGTLRSDDRLAIGVGVLGLLAAAAEERPVLVVIEDAQRLDDASAAALAFAARRVGGERVAVVAAIAGDGGGADRFSAFETLLLDRAARPAAEPAATGSPRSREAATAGGAGSSVGVLGGFRVSVAGRTVALAGLAKRLVALLALRAPVSSEEAVEVLWPDIDPEQGQGRLRKILWRVRQAGAGGLIVRRNGALALAPGVAVDVRRFCDAADAAVVAASAGDGRAADLARAAVSHYYGDLLPAARFDEWTAEPRENLRRRFVALLDLLSADAAGRKEHDEAVAYLDRAIEEDPYDEQRYLRAARLRLEQDRRAPALLLLQRAQQMMDGLGLPLSPSAVDLERQLRSD